MLSNMSKIKVSRKHFIIDKNNVYKVLTEFF